jgi:hypothetical protein
MRGTAGVLWPWACDMMGTVKEVMGCHGLGFLFWLLVTVVAVRLGNDLGCFGEE